MWLTAKIKGNEINIFNNDIKRKFNNIILYYPKIRGKLLTKKNLLGNYVFCYSPKFNLSYNYGNLKNIKGLDYFLTGNLKDQFQVKSFIDFCKQKEDKDGFVDNSLFKMNIKEKGKIISGPFVNFLFDLAKKGKNKIYVNIGNFKASISDNSVNLYQSI